MALKKCITALNQGGWRAEVGQLFDDSHVYVLTYPANFSDPAALEVTGDVTIGSDLILPPDAGVGIRRGTVDANVFGWKDLIGAIQPKTTGANTPTLVTWIGGQTRQFAFAAADKIDFVFHMPHDWVPGTDLFVHVHWGHNGTDISGSFVFDFHSTFARGFNQGATSTFGAEINSTLTVDSLTITNTPQYRHRVDEIQLSAASPTANQLDTDSLEVDGLLLMSGVMTTIPTITGGAAKPIIHTIDIHYQSHGGGTTANKAPNFYVLP